MHNPSHLPGAGEVFLDARGDSRVLRVSWHQEAGVVVLSLWREGSCAATFRLAVDEVPDLVDALRGGIGRAYDEAHTSLFGALNEPARAGRHVAG